MTTQQAIMAAIEDPKATRDKVSEPYATAIRSGDGIDWPAVNQAIIARWSMAGLQYVKDRAWKLAEGAPT